MLETLLQHTNMVRLSVGALAVLMMVGCTGLIDNGGGQGTPEERAARAKWISKALPQLQTNCGGCHAGAQPAIDFLSGDSDLAKRDTLLAFTPGVVNFDAPQSSRVLTKGPHNGPAFLAEQASDILEWLNAEKLATPDPMEGGPVLVTAQFIPQYCVGGDPGSSTCPINTVDLAPLGVAGAKISFTATAVSSGLYLSKLNIEGAAEGVYMEHPLFTSYLESGKVVTDTVDQLFSVKMNLMANVDTTVPPDGVLDSVKEQIGGGVIGFVGFGAGANDKLEIRFKALKTFQTDPGGMGSGSNGAGGGGGCKVLASFKTNAAGPLVAACAGCHAGGNNPNAKSAMNIDGANSADDAMVQLACNQVRTRINFIDTNLSGFFVAPNPGDPTNHQFKFNGVQADFNNFKAAVDPWVQAEKVAP